MLPPLPESKLIERPLTSPATAARMLKLGFSGRPTRASPPTFMRVRVPPGKAARSSISPPIVPTSTLPRTSFSPASPPTLPSCRSLPTLLILPSLPTWPTSTAPCTSLISQSPPTVPTCTWPALLTCKSPPIMPTVISVSAPPSTWQSPPTVPQRSAAETSCALRSLPTVPMITVSASSSERSEPAVSISTSATPESETSLPTLPRTRRVGVFDTFRSPETRVIATLGAAPTVNVCWVMLSSIPSTQQKSLLVRLLPGPVYPGDGPWLPLRYYARGPPGCCH